MKGAIMKTRVLIMLTVVAIVMSGCAKPQGDTLNEQRSSVHDLKKDTLAELYEKKPITKEKIAKAAGYAVFSNININLFLVSSGNGFGIVHNNSNGKETYMKMRMVGVGFGAGAKDFRAVMIFKTKEAMDTFVEKGWEWGGHADAAAKSGDKGAETGAAATVSGPIEIYQFTEAGIALQATVAGTKYWKDPDLN